MHIKYTFITLYTQNAQILNKMKVTKMKQFINNQIDAYNKKHASYFKPINHFKTSQVIGLYSYILYRNLTVTLLLIPAFITFYFIYLKSNCGLIGSLKYASNRIKSAYFSFNDYFRNIVEWR